MEDNEVGDRSGNFVDASESCSLGRNPTSHLVDDITGGFFEEFFRHAILSLQRLTYCGNEDSRQTCDVVETSTDVSRNQEQKFREQMDRRQFSSGDNLLAM